MKRFDLQGRFTELTIRHDKHDGGTIPTATVTIKVNDPSDELIARLAESSGRTVIITCTVENL